MEAPSKPQFAGPVYFSRTTDAGRTWEKARQIYDPGPNAQTIGNIVEVLPNGTVVDFFDETDAKGVLRIKQLRSFDHGKTFEKKPTLVSVQVNGAFVGTVTPDKQELVRDANILFDVAVDPKSGTLYAVWQDTRFEAPVQAVMFAQSTDGGDHWKVSSGADQQDARRHQGAAPPGLPALDRGRGRRQPGHDLLRLPQRRPERRADRLLGGLLRPGQGELPRTRTRGAARSG